MNSFPTFFILCRTDSGKISGFSALICFPFFFAVAAAVVSSSLIQTIAGFMFRMTHSFTANLYGARSALQHIYFDYAHIESEHLEKHQNNEWLKSLKIYERIIGRASIYAKHSNATVVVTDIGR